ncbi:MAG: helix-turn-helix domain-containing protein [Clostridia bacterium]|nr:helix-turn-helix domain-containing protein [Clostridia bacterium]
MTIGKRIKTRREQLKISQESLAHHLGLRSRSSIAKVESGANNLPVNLIEKAAEFLDTTPAYLLTGSRGVPLLGEIACGEPIFADEHYECLIETHTPADFCLKAKGDSMTGARIYDGDIVFIRKCPTVENGEIAAVLIGDEATLKRVYKKGDTLELHPENPDFPIMTYKGVNLNSVRILGRAVAFYGKLN